ncbi:MAG TPA: head GIN domain-containing protein [Lacibacter sp.]|nr:head GIN domain-containing protein [Lacibacter sp.]HMO87527.1 head GIN domain-containing protein [Lacibacter sp.]HMP87934.1 head GIN domain-containing protein [Lacibacter sp.]
MRHVLNFILFMLVLPALQAQQVHQNPDAEMRNVQGFRSIQVGDGIELFLSQGSEEEVAVSASRDNYRQRLKTDVKDGVLRIYYDRESLSDWTGTAKKLRAYVSFRSLEKITATAGSQVHLEGVLRVKDLVIVLHSGAHFRGRLETGSLALEAASGAKAELSGSTGTFQAKAESGARVDAYGIASGKADIRVSSGARVQATIEEEMKLYASSGGAIHYKGKGRISSVETKMGSVVRREE